MTEIRYRRQSRLLVIALLSAITGSVALATPPATKSTASTARTTGIGAHGFQQIAVTTTDLPRAIAFYRDALGLRLMFESNGMAFFDVGGTRLMVALDAQRPQARATAVLYFDAPDFHATRAALQALDVPFDGGIETVDRRADTELKLQQFTDPDGNALAIMGWVERS